MELNRAIHDDAAQPEHFALVERSPLLSALDHARSGYEPTPEGIIETGARIAYGIAAAQAFRDGNRRTAYWATRAFLQENGFGFLMSEDDHMVARYLNRLVDDQGRARPSHVTAGTFSALFSRRLRNRHAPDA